MTGAAHQQSVPAPRPPDVLMRADQLAALQPCRLSASRALLIRASRERWRITRLRFDIDERARGEAFYRIETPGRTFDFPVFSFEFSPVGRTGRIIGRSWDMMAALVEGPMSARDVERTREELPKLYSGRATPGTLIWCRSNRSSRAFNHSVERLAAGCQPDPAVVGEVCYLMRNTGLDGNGTFGTRSFRSLEAGHPLRTSLSAQMLCAYLMRVFVQDLVEHLARCRSPHAVPFSREIARYLGIGNGSALGLVLFVNNHPRLIDLWLSAHEESLAVAKALTLGPGDVRLAKLSALLERAIRFRREDRVKYDRLTPSARIAEDLETVREAVGVLSRTGEVDGARCRYPLAALCDAMAKKVGSEARETLNALLIELVPEVADTLAQSLIVDEEIVARPEMSNGALRELLHANYRWALEMDISRPESSRYVWYKSVNAEEPRRGPKDTLDYAFNLGLDIPRLAQTLEDVLADADLKQSTGRLMLAHPELRAFIARVQALDGLRYHSPIMNMMAEDFIPIEIVSMMNVGLHGIDKTRDYLNRNLRGVLYHGAPLPDEIAAGVFDDGFWPAEPSV